MSLEISLKNLRKEILKPKQTYLGCNQLNEIKKSLSFDKDFLLLFRAEDEGRTRDIQLGRLTLYQLSYFRILRFLNLRIDFSKSGRRGSNSRHSAWKADALPTELLPHFTIFESSY